MDKEQFLISLMDSVPCKSEVMGILNLDPGSFYTPSISKSIDEAIKKLALWQQLGLKIIDIGAFTSRPGAEIPSPIDEWNRLSSFLDEIIKAFPALVVSVDTVHHQTADRAIQMGADIINDISGGTYDPDLLNVLASNHKTLIAMHMRGTPKTMQSKENTHYDSVVSELIQYFAHRLYTFRQAGINRVMIDPGFGFSKTLTDNYKILTQLELFKILDAPIVVGMSRKSMFWKLLDTSSEHVLGASIAAHTIAAYKGCKLLRVHDVPECLQAIAVVHMCHEQFNSKVTEN